MKHATIIIAAILMAITVNGQVKGVDLSNAVKVNSEMDLMNHIEEWTYQSEDEIYIFTISMMPKPVDYKHLITELNRILEANDLDINKPDEEDDLLPSRINGLTDYSNLDHYVRLGEAEIMRRYYLDNGWIIAILCNYQTRGLVLGKIQE